MSPSRTFRPFVVVALAGALVTAGCTSDDGADTDRADGATTTTAVEPATSSARVLERYADHESEHYEDPTKWVCRPDAEDICDDDLTTTVIEADGSTEVREHTPAEDPAVDCFYVYPTISRDATTFSDWDFSPEEEGFVTLQQAARLSEVCRVFAPVYRQRTLTSLAARLAGGDGEPDDAEPGDPFADVLDAFRTYMANDNEGRGFVLVGHSQGSGMLNQLIASEIDPDDDLRELLVAAYLVGSTVRVPEDGVVGGDFDNVPLCTAGDETGCVLTWATFRDSAPPPEGSLFGRVRSGDGTAGCVNPASVEGGSADLQAYFPSDASASILAALGSDAEGRTWLEGSDIDTPFVTLPGLVSGECVSHDGASYLSVTVHGDPDDPRADDIAGDLSPEWGLHLVDVSIAMGDIVERVGEQAEAHTG
jgi:hypothetical protein